MVKKSKKIQGDFNPTVAREVETGNAHPVYDSSKWIVFLILFFIGMVFYFNAFTNGFIWDDEMVITPNLFIRDWAHLKEIFFTDIHHFGLDKSNYYRPMQAVSYMLDYTLWQLNPMGYHISSVLIHILNAVLVYLTMFLVVSSVGKRDEDRSRYIAAASSLVWLVHPVHTQVVTYAAGRADQLVASFMLLTLYTFARGQAWWVSSGFFVLALLSKEYAVITPAFITLFYCFGLGKTKSSFLKALLPYVIILTIYIILRLTVLNFPTDFKSDLIPGLYQRMLTSSVAVAILIRLLFFPFDLSMDRNIEWRQSIFDPSVWGSIFLILMVVVLCWKVRKKWPVIFFGLVWFCLGYLLVANIIPMNANVSEHWLYLPSVGIWLVFFYTLDIMWTGSNKNIRSIFIIILTIYFGIILINRNKDFRDEIIFYNQILKRQYKNARVHYNLGCAYFYAGKETESYEHLMEAIRFKPDYAAAYGNLGQLEFRKGNIDQAIQLYETANVLKADLLENRVNLAVAYIKKDRFQEGIDQLTVALKLNPNHVAALNNMGIAFGSQGDFATAERYFKSALTIDPTDASAQNNLARLSGLMKQDKK